MAKLPKLHLDVGFSISKRLGITLVGEPLDLSKLKPAGARLEELQSRSEVGSDPEYQFDLAAAYAELGQSDKSRESLQRAIIGFRSKLQTRPDDGWLRTQLARALWLDQKQQEAEQLFRSATHVSPTDWRCWAALGDFLTQQVLAIFSAKEQQVHRSEHATFKQSAIRPELTARDLARAREQFAEAKACYDQAVSSAPRNADAVSARCLFRWQSGQLIEPALYPEPGRPSVERAWQQLAGFLADLKERVKLTKTDPYAIGFAALFEAMAVAKVSSPNELFSGSTWLHLPDSSQQYIQDLLSQLRAMTEHSDTTVAAGALASLGTVQFFLLRDLASAENNLRAATRVNPRASAAWDVLLTVLVVSERWGDLVDLCLDRLQRQESAEWYYKLAKAYERIGRADKIETALREAIRLAPANHVYQLAVFSLELRQATDDDDLAAVGHAMEHWKRANEKSKCEHVLNFEFLHGIFFALAGNHKAALQHAENLLKVAPENPEYKRFHAALTRK